MAQRKGRCTNFGNCTVADTKQILQIPEGTDMVCTGCARQLTEVGGTEKRPSWTGFLVGLALVAVVVGWFAWSRLRSKPPLDGQPLPPGSSQVLLRLHGSNTIGEELAPALVEAFLKDQGASRVQVVPAGKDQSRVEGVLPGESSPKVIEIEAHGSATAFQDLATGKCDIGMASRKINSVELASLSQMGDMTSPSSEHVLGLDGIAVIVNPSNPVRSLTKDQLAKIFSGEITEWKQLLSPRGTIKVYARDDKSGTYDSFKSMVLGSSQLVRRAVRLEDSQELSDKVAADADAIGFVGLPFVRSAKAVSVSEEKSQPLLPTRMTVSTEDYPLSRRLYLYTPPNPSGAWTRKFVTFALSKSGQDVVGGHGFVGQTVEATRMDVGPGGCAEQKKLTAGGERLSLNFRFRTGSSELDNKALPDLDRMVSFLSDLKYSGQNVILIGFADNTGKAESNLALSKNRAGAVAAQFAPRGIAPGVVTGCGAEMPVASNQTDEGREKNRRVEVWIKK